MCFDTGSSFGIHGKVSRSTLADANGSRDWRSYGDFAQTQIAEARRLYCEEAFSHSVLSWPRNGGQDL